MCLLIRPPVPLEFLLSQGPGIGGVELLGESIMNLHSHEKVSW